MSALLEGLAATVGRWRWLRFGVRNRFARAVHSPDAGRGGAVDAPFHGLRYVGDSASFIDWSVKYFGAYAEWELQLFGELLSWGQPGTIVDVGANVGHHTLYFASTGRSVIAFEPVPALAAQIRRKLELNRLTNVQLQECGLGNVREALPFFASNDSNQGTGSFLAQHEGRTAVQIEVRRGDDELARLAVGEVGLIKIDVEGFESSVLAGLEETLARHRPPVFFEWSAASAEHAGQKDPRTYFPDNYTFLNCTIPPAVAGIFARSGFELLPWTPTPGFDGNLLALPGELQAEARRRLHVRGAPC